MALVTSRIVGWHIPAVTLLSVLRKVQSLDFLPFLDSQSDSCIHDLESDQSAHDAECPSYSGSDQLIGIALEEP